MAAELSALCDLAISLNSQTFAAGHYEAAYHALMSALHCAQDLRDEVRLEEVARIATEQGRQIDSLSPVHRLSSAAAKARGHQAVFELAAQQAHAQASMVHVRVGSRQSDGP